MKQLLLAFPLALFPLAAAAEDAAMLAQYWTDSGSVSPEYAWEATVTILEDGSLSLKYCTGYSTEGPDCRTRSAKVSDDQLEAIRAAALESGLKDTPAKELSDDMIPIGGSATGGRVVVDGQEVDLLSFPTEEDAPRVAKVLQAIHDAIPDRLRRKFMDES